MAKPQPFQPTLGPLGPRPHTPPGAAATHSSSRRHTGIHTNTEVCEKKSGERAAYTRFVPTPTAHRACSAMRPGPKNSGAMSLSEIQKHVKEKMGGHPPTVMRERGHIQRHEFRRILHNYCIQLTDREFQRLWNHHCPNNTSTISYQVFLDQLGLGDGHDLHMAPVCTKLEVSGRGTTPPDRVQDRKLRPLLHNKDIEVDKLCEQRGWVLADLKMFDPKRTGYVAREHLKRVLSCHGMPLSDTHFHRLTQISNSRPGTSSSLVNYNGFLRNLGVPQTADTHTSSSSSSSSSPRQIHHTKRPHTSPPILEDSRAITDMLAVRDGRIKCSVFLEKYEDAPTRDGQQSSEGPSDMDEVIPLLPSVDRTRIKIIHEFDSVWSQMPVNEKNRLQYAEVLKPAGTVSATKYCRPKTAAAVLQHTKSSPQLTSRRVGSAGRPGTGSLAGSAENNLHGAVQRCWGEIQRGCMGKDPHRDGHIGATSFLEVLRCSLGMAVTREKCERLCTEADALIRDGRVSYLDFLAHFLLNVKPAEAKTTLRRSRLPLTVTPAIRGALSRGCVEVMLRVHDRVTSCWTSIRRCFLTCDRSRSGTVSVQDFRKVLLRFRVVLSEEDFFQLSSYFDANAAGNIFYNSFLWAFLR